MVMQARTAVRSLVLSLAAAVAGPALAQSIDKEPSSASKQGTAKAAAKSAPKRLDFVPGSSVKETTTRAATTSTPQRAQMPTKQGSGCLSADLDA
jgi:hypothetical protein